jgi:hypothetical protein
LAQEPLAENITVLGSENFFLKFDSGIKYPLPSLKRIHCEAETTKQAIIAQPYIQNSTTFSSLPVTTSLNSKALENDSDHQLT